MSDLFTKVKNRVSVFDAVSLLDIELNSRGQISCPFHDEKIPSCSIHSQFFKCFGCSASGDVVSFWAKSKNVSNYDAALDLAERFNIEHEKISESGSYDYKTLWPYTNSPIEVYSYIGESSKVLTDEVRYYFKKSDRKKQSIFISHETRGLRFGWSEGEYFFDTAHSTWKQVTPKKRIPPGSDLKTLKAIQFPLYREDLIINNHSATVVITEGPKDAKNLNDLKISGFVASTIAGGTNGKFHDIHLRCLKDRNVIILPDNETVGIESAKRRKDILNETCRSVKVIPPFKIRKGSDVSDQIENEKSLGKSDETISDELKNVFESMELSDEEIAVPFQTDDANARRLSERVAGTLVYIGDDASWYVWDGSRYKEDHGNSHLLYARESAGELVREASFESDTETAKSKHKHAVKSLSAASIRSAVYLAKSEKSLTRTLSDFDSDPFLLNTKNGTIHFDSDNGAIEFMAHDARNANDRPLVMNCCNTKYDKESKCPVWEEVLSDVMITENGETSPELIKFWQTVIGSSVLAKIWEKRFYLCFGPGDDGKSMTIGTIHSILGDYSYSLNFNALLKRKFERDANPDLAGLNRRRFAWAMESEQGAVLDEGILNLITGGDPLTFRMLNKNPITFDPTHTLIIGTSNLPAALAKDRGFWGRFQLIPFNAYFTENVNSDNPLHRKLIPLAILKERLSLERPGILNWIVRGTERYLKDGLKTPEIVRDATNRFKENQDPLASWISERVEAHIDHDVYVGVKILRDNYLEWCMNNDITAIGKMEYDRRLQVALPGISPSVRGKLANVRAWNGVCLKPGYIMNVPAF